VVNASAGGNARKKEAEKKIEIETRWESHKSVKTGLKTVSKWIRKKPVNAKKKQGRAQGQGKKHSRTQGKRNRQRKQEPYQFMWRPAIMNAQTKTNQQTPIERTAQVRQGLHMIKRRIKP